MEKSFLCENNLHFYNCLNFNMASVDVWMNFNNNTRKDKFLSSVILLLKKLLEYIDMEVITLHKIA